MTTDEPVCLRPCGVWLCVSLCVCACHSACLSVLFSLSLPLFLCVCVCGCLCAAHVSARQILNSGEVPDLFAPDDLTKVMDDMVPVARELSVPQTREQLYQVRAAA